MYPEIRTGDASIPTIQELLGHQDVKMGMVLQDGLIPPDSQWHHTARLSSIS